MSMMYLTKALQITLSFASTSSLLFKATMATASQQMMKAVSFKDSSPSSMFLAEVERPSLKDGQVLLKVHASAVNRADTLQRKGRYPPPKGESDILGLEASGEIIQIQDSCQKSWSVGDKVMALLAGGGNSEYVAVDCRHVMPVPKSLSMVEAGGVPEVWLTAYQLLHVVGKLQPTDTVLIHAGASGVGTAAIQLVKLHGARSFITAGSDDKISFTKSLGAADGFNYKVGNWAEQVLSATNGRGVDLVLDCVGGSYWKQNSDVLAMDGRWVLYGALGGVQVDGPLFGTLLRKRISLLSTTLRSRNNEYKAKLVESFVKNALPHFDEMKLKPIVETVFDLKDIGKAHDLMESNKTIGKILLKVLNEKDEL